MSILDLVGTNVSSKPFEGNIFALRWCSESFSMLTFSDPHITVTIDDEKTARLRVLNMIYDSPVPTLHMGPNHPKFMADFTGVQNNIARKTRRGRGSFACVHPEIDTAALDAIRMTSHVKFDDLMSRTSVIVGYKGNPGPKKFEFEADHYYDAGIIMQLHENELVYLHDPASADYYAHIKLGEFHECP